MCTVTNGADYQYDITYGYVATGGYSPAIHLGYPQAFSPKSDQALSVWANVPGPLLFAAMAMDFLEEISLSPSAPRFSHTYGDIPTHGFHPNRKSLFETVSSSEFRYLCVLEQAINSLNHFEGYSRQLNIYLQSSEKKSIPLIQ